MLILIIQVDPSLVFTQKEYLNQQSNYKYVHYNIILISKTSTEKIDLNWTPNFESSILNCC